MAILAPMLGKLRVYVRYGTIALYTSIIYLCMQEAYFLGTSKFITNYLGMYMQSSL